MVQIIKKSKKVDKYNFPYTLPSPYTGCSFGCEYCYSIKSSLWSARLNNWGIAPNTAKPKPDVVNRVKKDLLLLDKDTSKDARIQIGNFFDPYPNIESKQNITKDILQEFTNHPEWEIHIETKNPLITRDKQLLKQLDAQAEITITTLTHDKQIEPYAPSTNDRFDAIEELSDYGVYVRVMIMPILGKLTDVQAIWSKAQSLGAKDYKTKPLSHYPNINNFLRNKYGI